MRAIYDLKHLILPVYPNLIERIRQLIEDSERQFSQDRDNEKENVDSFLWEHTIHVAAIARKIALAEDVNATEVVISALFHDSGKFLGGHYHSDDIPEEERAAHLAEEVLTEEGMDKEKIGTITSSLTALYNEKHSPSRITDVVHDADFLAKFGYLGVANFFVKSALRGQNLYKTLISSLSKELTYAATLKSNMRTATGKKLAEKKSVATLSYYQGLLDELREAGIAYFKIIEEAFPCPKNPNKILTLRMAVPEVCPECSNELSMSFVSQTQIKCEQLSVKIHCVRCTSHYQISFCLPEFDQ
ncbi:MAG: HD domain-containing protein [Candidatus Aminicenantaceae bacterium]